MHCFYEVTLHSPMGPKRGLLRLHEREKAITGNLYLLGRRNPVQGKRVEREWVQLHHPLRTAVSDYACVSTLCLRGEKLLGTAAMGKLLLRWTGRQKRLSLHPEKKEGRL